MPKGTCSICGEAVYAREWCLNHYRRWHRHGDPLGGLWRSADGKCSEDGCDEPHKARGWCKKHYRRWQRRGDPQIVLPPPAPLPGPANFYWAGDEVGYRGLHSRVCRERGAAATHPCAHADGTCKGRIEWANISHEYLGVEDFMPLCQSHHFRYDKAAGQWGLSRKTYHSSQ